MISDDNFVLMHNNTFPHVARIIINYLPEVGILVVDCPANRPDLNRIQHVWDHLERCIRTYNIAPDSFDKLRDVSNEKWENLGMDYVRNLIRSLST